MAESSDIEMHIGRQVINRNYDALKKYMHPDPVIDCKTDFVLLTDTERNSIKDKDLTDKNDTLLKIVISKGAKGYTDFKERLRKTWQTELLELIVCSENGQDTNEMEGRLAELWYIKHKREEEGEEEEDSNYSRDEIIEMNLKNHSFYISHCIKPDVLIQYLQCYTTDQKSDILAEKSPIRASRKALDMLFDSVEDQGRFAALRDALDRNGGYPKIVRILDGEYEPEDRNFVRIVELFAPELIGLIRPSELLPHLLSKRVFTQEDVQEITSEENNHGALRAACILLMYLPRRVMDWYRSFLNILIDCKLEDTAKMLDPDFYIAITQERERTQHHGIGSIKHSSNAQKQKPKIKPKPKFIPSRDKDDDSEDEIEYTEFNEEELEYVLDNQKEREKLEETMIYIDVKILWPERKQGEKQRILLRSLSKEEYRDACIWSRKRKMWKRNALKIFQDLFGQVKVSRNRCAKPNLSKIMSRKDNSSPSHKDCLYGRRFKKVYTPTRSFCPNENQDEDTGSRSSTESCQKQEEDKETESEPEIVKSKDTEKIAECLMACGRRIFIMKGSLVDIEAEAVVNTTNKCLPFETGISKTIRDKGGSSIQAACHQFLQTQRSIDEGDTLVSEAGDLQAKYVIHVNSPVCDKRDSEEETLLKKTVGRVLMQASRTKARTIAIPAIGCGNSGWPPKTAAPLIVGAVRNFFREEQDSSVRHVYLVDLISKTTQRFHQALCDTFKDDDKCVIEPPAS